jgi:8-oxo-dGTP pyrophosphatase MutT (NUDIX family)
MKKVDKEVKELITELENYQPFDDDEKESLSFAINFLKNYNNQGKNFDRSNNPFNRNNYNGHVTGSAFILNNDRTKTLFTHHKKIDMWLQLGGHAENNETNAFDVALREAKEESGIKTFKTPSKKIINVDVQLTNAKNDVPAHPHIDIWYLFESPSEKITISNESNDLKWFTIDELETIKIVDKSINRMVKKWTEGRL